MEFPLKTSRERGIAVALLVLWALLFLPNLRTNPNWYGDEGEWMEMSWTTAHGTPRIGPLKNDFLFPTPYPPLYMIVNGALLRIFGYDIVVGRALGAVTALVAGAVLFWIGTRLRGKKFGFLCVAAFLVYPEAVINFRWVRSHPMAGTLALTSVGFLIRYVQEKRLQDVIWAGVFCSLATASNYFAYPLIAAVVLTTLFVNWRHSVIAAASAGAFIIVFLGWYLAFQPGGIAHLMEQAARSNSMAGAEADPSLVGFATRFYRNVLTFGLLTPTVSLQGSQGVDLWLIGASLGVILFPVARFRKWFVLWLLALMFAVFRKLDNVPIFFYPATIFLPLMAVGFAGFADRLGELAGRMVKGTQESYAHLLTAVAILMIFGAVSLNGSLGHFRTKIDMWTQHSAINGEAAAEFINSHTSKDDFVIAPKQLYWLVKNARHAMLWQTVPYEGGVMEAYPVPIPRDLFWFDCHWKNAKYIVLAYGRDDAAGRPYGLDAVYTFGLKGMREIVEAIQSEKWSTVFQQGEYMVLANPRFTK